MIEKATAEKTSKTENGNDGMEWHEERDSWTPECCVKRIRCGCCFCRCDQELEKILYSKRTDDILDSALEVALNSGLYNDVATDEETDGETSSIQMTTTIKFHSERMVGSSGRYKRRV